MTRAATRARAAAALLLGAALACGRPGGEAPCAADPIPPEIATPDRVVPGTTVVTCPDGPHAEDWPGGGPAVRGAREGGAPVGVWTLTARDGAPDGELTHDGGRAVQRTLRSASGRWVELTLADGRVVAFRERP